MPADNGRLKILDIWVDPVTMQQALDRVVEFVEKGERPHAVFAVNPEKNFSVPKDPGLYEHFRNADLLIPDGIGIVLAARILHGASLSRVPGVELMDNICALSSRKGYRVFIYGAKEEVNHMAAARLLERHPSLKIVGRANGYVRDEEMPGLVREINESEAQVLFLALGSPKQEKWYSTYGSSLRTVRVCQGIGGTLDTIAGNVKRAPDVWCRMNLEWLYRLLSDPRRLSRQKVLPVFAWQVLMAKISGSATH